MQEFKSQLMQAAISKHINDLAPHAKPSASYIKKRQTIRRRLAEIAEQKYIDLINVLR